MYIFPIFLTISMVTGRTFEYPIQDPLKSFKTTHINLPSIQEKHNFRTHGVNNIDFSRHLISHSAYQKSAKKRKQAPRSVKAASEFERKLAEQIEEDQVKFVADEKNPMKYVVEKGLLYKQSRFSPIARVEMPMRTSVFHGNIKRQMKAVSISSNTLKPVPVHVKKSYPISHDKRCEINRFGFECCDQLLENLMLKSYEKLKRKQEAPDLMTISMILKQDTKNFFTKNFDVIVSPNDFATSISSNFHCKVQLGNLNLVAFAFVPLTEEMSSIRRRNIPYHELARDDFQETADLVVSRNGIVIAH